MKNGAKRHRKTHVFEVVVTYCPKTPGPYKYAVEVPGLPGCFSDGRSEAEALGKVREAITLYLEARRDLNRKNRRLIEVTL